MRKSAVVLVLILFSSLSSGCLGGDDGGPDETEVLELRNEIGNLTAENQVLTEDMAILNNDLSSYTSIIADLGASLDLANESLEQMLSELANNSLMISNLTEISENLSRDLQRAIDENLTTISSLEDEIGNITALIAVLEIERDAALENISSKESEIVNLLTSISEAEHVILSLIHI